MSDRDRVLCCLALKITQRRRVEDIAQQLGLTPSLTWWTLHFMSSYWTRENEDGTWSLTSAGNVRRNELTAAPQDF